MNILSKEQISNLPDWLPVRDFEGLYEVNCREGLVRNARTLKVLKPSPDSGGYPSVGLREDGKQHLKNVHRIVALTAFGYYGIQTDGLCVCHLDEERHNPNVSNLALGTQRENMNFEKAKQRESEAHKGYNHHMFGKHHSEKTRMKISEANKGRPNIKCSKRVGAYKNGELILTFESTREAHRNAFNHGAVSACCLGKRKTYKGYIWQYLTA